jgi:hypothetical protein
MLLALQTAFRDFLQAGLPTLFGGETPTVTVDFPAYEWHFDASSADATAGEPAQDDARDHFAFDPASPEGPYILSRPPYPGPRRVYLRSSAGDRLALTASETRWDADDVRSLTLVPKPSRELSGFDQVEILYGVTAVFTQLTATLRMPIDLKAAEEAAAEEALSLALAAFALNRSAIMKDGSFTHARDGYRTLGEIKNLKLERGDTLLEARRRLFLDVEVEMKVSRALADGEGRPIQYIISPGLTPDPAHPVKVRIDIEG